MLDTDLFLKDEDNQDYTEVISWRLLPENNVSFNEWVTNTRQVFKAHYLKKLHRAISRHYDSGNLSFVSPSAKNRCR